MEGDDPGPGIDPERRPIDSISDVELWGIIRHQGKGYC